MKRCPECGREYDNSMAFCLDDGTELLYGPATTSSEDGPATAILPGSEGLTRQQIHTTDRTVILPAGAEPQSSYSGLTGKQGVSANRSAKPLVAAVIAVAVLIVGFFAYRYFNSAATEQVNSIAVLPFENRSGSSDADYLSDGLADSLIYRLSQLPNLKVSPTSSVMRYKGKETDVAQIAKELEVDAVMSGRLVQRGDDLSISVQFIDSRTGKLIWAEQYERKMTELLATQREIATAITQKLQLKLSGDEAKGVTKKYTDSNEAYQAYLKGRYYWNRRTAENLKKAIEEFKSATDRDPNFALAYNGLADCYAILPEYAGAPATDVIPQAKAYAERAIAIDEQLGEPHATLGIVYVQLWQWAESEREYKRAIEINPNYATAYHWYSILLKNQGRNDEAAKMIMKASELDPLSGAIGCNISMIYQMQGDHDASIKNSLKMIELDPNFGRAYEYLGLSYFKVGRKEEAVRAMEKAVELTKRQNVVLSELGFLYGAVGKRIEALAVAKELEEKYARKEAAGHEVAGVYSGLGEKDKAFEWLEKDFENRDSRLNTFRWETQFEPLREDPRFRDLLRRMGLPE